MKPEAVATLSRIAVLAVLVIAALMSGGQTVPTNIDTVDIAAAPTVMPTGTPLVDLTTETVPTQAPVEPTSTPESPPLVVNTPVTQQTTSARGTFPVPPNTTGYSIIVERGPEDKHWVALSFDAGETTGYTTEILDLLAEYGIHASFGVTGEWARANPNLVNRILDEGHLMFNHSESHRSWTGDSPGTAPLTIEERTEQVLGSQESVAEIADWDLRPFWRPPYGDLDFEGRELLASLGYDYTFWWTCDTLAWMEYTPDEIAARCSPDSDFGGPGAIILMHVEQKNDYWALQPIIDAYASEGYEFVTLNEMISN